MFTKTTKVINNDEVESITTSRCRIDWYKLSGYAILTFLLLSGLFFACGLAYVFSVGELTLASFIAREGFVLAIWVPLIWVMVKDVRY